MIRTPTFTRAVLREILSTFLLALVLCTAVLLFEKIFRIMKMAAGVGAGDLLKLILYIQPSFLMLGIPMSLLVSILIVYGRMTMDHETTVLMAAGAPFSVVARPAVVFGVLGMIVAFGVTLYLFPFSNRMFRQTLFNALKESVKIEEGMFNTRFPGITIYAGERRADGRYGDLFIHNARKPEEPMLITAERGELFMDPERDVFQFLFEDGSIHLPAAGNRYTLLEFGRYFMEIGALGDAGARINREAMYVGELMEARRREGPAGLRYEIELHRRFALPVVCLILGFLAVPLAMQAGRSGRLGGFGIALGVLSGYYALLVFGENLARSGTLAPALAMWLPNGVLLVLALLLRWQREKVSRQ